MKQWITCTLVIALLGLCGGCAIDKVGVLSYRSVRQTAPGATNADARAPMPTPEQLGSIATFASLSPELRAVVFDILAELIENFPEIIRATQEPLLEAVKRGRWFEEEHEFSILSIIYPRTGKKE